MTEISVEDLAGRLSHHFRRIFHTREGSLELHLSILDGIAARYRSPFFSALRSYSHRPATARPAPPPSTAGSLGFAGLVDPVESVARPAASASGPAR